ncbi:MAG: transporter substrate-binding domain-containing protein [Burkholderiaceae bacterium]|nr:transporter substrate-binding domain-containing protein [Burkholderiaceae bacterium]
MRFALLLSLWFSLCSANAPAQARELLFASTHYPPYTSSTDPQNGAMVRLARDLLMPLGYTLEVRTLPWQRLLQERTRYDGILMLWPNEAKDLKLVAYKGVFKSRLGFYTRTDTPVDVSSIKAVGQRTVGVTRGYGYPDQLLRSDLHLEYAADDLSNLRKLKARRFDIVVLERVVGDYWINEHPELGGLQWNEPPMAEIPLGFAVVPGRPGTVTLTRDLENSLRQYIARGDLTKLTKAYGIDPWSSETKRGKKAQ